MIEEGPQDAAAGVVDQKRGGAERLNGLPEERACNLLFGKIAPKGFARLARRFPGGGLVKIGKHDAGAIGLKTACDRESDAAAGPGDECHTVRRSEEHTTELQSLMRISIAVFCLKNKKEKTLKRLTQD